MIIPQGSCDPSSQSDYSSEAAAPKAAALFKLIIQSGFSFGCGYTLQKLWVLVPYFKILRDLGLTCPNVSDH